MLQRGFIVALHLEHQPQAEVNFIGPAEPWLDVQDLLERLDGPGEDERKESLEWARNGCLVKSR